MSIPFNNIVREIGRKSIFEESKPVTPTSLSYNQGDLLCFDASTHQIVQASAETEAETFLGVAVETIQNGMLVGPYPLNISAAQSSLPGPAYGVIASLYLKVGDVLNPGDSVYLDPASGPQFVQDSGTKPIGTYQGPGAVTGAAGTLVECLLGARYPGDALRF